MKQRKLLLAMIFIAPIFAMASCNNADTATVTLTADAGAGIFLNSNCYKVITIKKNTPLKDAIGDMPVLSAEEFCPGASFEFLCLTPVAWFDDNGQRISNNYVINDSMTIHARYFFSLEDAKAVALQKIGMEYMSSCAQQPEDINKITSAYKIATNYIKDAKNEPSALGMSIVGEYEMYACAREPFAIDNFINNAEYYYQTLAVLDNSCALGLGKTGKSAMDTFARLPEEKDIMNNVAKKFTEAAKQLPAYAGYGFGEFGYRFMESCNRQLEAIPTMLENATIVFDGFNRSINSVQASCIGKLGDAWSQACERQPEAITRLTDSLKINIENILNS